MRRLYTLLLYAALPFVALSGRLRGSPAGPGTPGWRERLGFGPSGSGRGLWVHAASVGEVQAAAVLLEALRVRDSRLDVALSCGTATGYERARALLPGVDVRYAPYDLPRALRRWLAGLRPRLLVLIETELWPNLLHEARRASVPTLIGSARVSARSARWYRRLPGLLRGALRTNVWVGAQTPADAERFRALGVPPGRVSVIGNLKFDRTLPTQLRVRGAALRARFAATRPLWTAGSTHAGEETIVLEAHRQLCRRLPEALLVIAPRHPQRFEEADAVLAAGGWRYLRRSSTTVAGSSMPRDAGLQEERSCQVLLLDTLGELVDFYAGSDVAFVGGSLVPVGGHNLLEPAALGVPVLSGPQQFNSPDIARILRHSGGLRIVKDAADLAAAVEGLLRDPAARRTQGEKARGAIEAHRGALARLVELVDKLRAHADGVPGDGAAGGSAAGGSAAGGAPGLASSSAGPDRRPESRN